MAMKTVLWLVFLMLDVALIRSVPVETSAMEANKTESSIPSPTPETDTPDSTPKESSNNTLDVNGSEFSFFPDHFPDLADDERAKLSEDSTPLSFLKSPPIRRVTVKPVIKGAQAPPAVTSPIYITVPIYINAGGSIPLSLAIGGQEIPLAGATHLSQSGDKILSNEDPSNQNYHVYRETNRHRSNPRPKIYARHDRDSPLQYQTLRRNNVK